MYNLANCTIYVFYLSLQEEQVVDEVVTASCNLVCEWAQKLLSRQFGTVGELAQFLVQSSYVNSCSRAAFTVLAASQRKNVQSTATSTSTTSQPQQSQANTSQAQTGRYNR